MQNEGCSPFQPRGPVAFADPADLSPWLAVLEKQFPPATPLDEDDRDDGFR